MINFVDNLFQPAAFDAISSLVRPSCPFPGWRSSPDSPAGILFGSDGSSVLSFTPAKYSCQMRSGAQAAGGPVALPKTPPSAFETRLGPPAALPAEISDIGDQFSEAPPSNPVLIVVDANKEVNTSALDWAISYIVQKGDSVKLLGVLHHIHNPSKCRLTDRRLGLNCHFRLWCTFLLLLYVRCSGLQISS